MVWSVPGLRGMEFADGGGPLRTPAGAAASLRSASAKPLPQPERVLFQDSQRINGVGEFDRVIGGGIVAGSVICVGGPVSEIELLLQICQYLSEGLKSFMYRARKAPGCLNCVPTA